MAEPTNTVYSYYLPEVREEVEKCAQFYPHHVYEQNYKPGLDDFHELVIDSYETVHEDRRVTGFDTFPNRYPLNGSSEGLFHILAEHKAHRRQVPLYQFGGEYQGFNEYARTLGLRFQDVYHMDMIDTMNPGLWFVSQPSAVHGNILLSSTLERILARHEVVLDLAYLGMTPPFELDLTHPNIKAVVASLSKPLGLYYFRTGFAWSREPIASLYANKWFKNIWSLHVAEHLLGTLDFDQLYDKYSLLQAKAANHAQTSLGVPVIPSDVFLLAYGIEGSGGPEEFQRGYGYRYCLTPYLMEMEKARV